MAAKTTVKDIAGVLNTTGATVSTASNKSRSSTETKAHIYQAAYRPHYRRNKIASSFYTEQTATIGVIIPGTPLTFSGSVVFCIETEASQAGYSILLYQSNKTSAFEKKPLDAFISARMDGVIASIAKHRFEHSDYRHIKQLKIAPVIFQNMVDSLSVPVADLDDFEDGMLTTERLIQQVFR